MPSEEGSLKQVISGVNYFREKNPNLCAVFCGNKSDVPNNLDMFLLKPHYYLMSAKEEKGIEAPIIDLIINLTGGVTICPLRKRHDLPKQIETVPKKIKTVSTSLVTFSEMENFKRNYS